MSLPLHRLLRAFYSALHRPYPPIGEVTEYTPELERVLREDGWSSWYGYHPAMRPIVFSSPSGMLLLRLCYEPLESAWSASVGHFVPWPEGMSDEDKLTYLRTNLVRGDTFTQEMAAKYPGVPVHLCLVRDAIVVTYRNMYMLDPKSPDLEMFHVFMVLLSSFIKTDPEAGGTLAGLELVQSLGGLEVFDILLTHFDR